MSVRRWGSISTTPYTGDIPEILKSQELLTKPAGGAVVTANTGKISPGSFVRRLTSGGTFYYWLPTKVAKVDTLLGAVTATTFYVRNPVFLVGDTITVGPDNGTIAAINYDTGLITTVAALVGGAPANGARVFSQTAADLTIDAISLDFLPNIPDSAQAVEVAISGIFKKDYFDMLYHATDIATWGAIAVPAFNAYRWS